MCVDDPEPTQLLNGYAPHLQWKMWHFDKCQKQKEKERCRRATFAVFTRINVELFKWVDSSVRRCHFNHTSNVRCKSMTIFWVCKNCIKGTFFSRHLFFRNITSIIKFCLFGCVSFSICCLGDKSLVFYQTQKSHCCVINGKEEWNDGNVGRHSTFSPFTPIAMHTTNSLDVVPSANSAYVHICPGSIVHSEMQTLQQRSISEARRTILWLQVYHYYSSSNNENFCFEHSVFYVSFHIFNLPAKGCVFQKGIWRFVC